MWNDEPDLAVDVRLARCRRAISAWSREQYLNRKAEINKLKLCLDMAMTDPHGDDIFVGFLNAKLLLAYKAEEEFWRQRSRIMWLSAGDKNSGYFHAIAKGRCTRNRLSTIEDPDGKAYYEEDQIAGQISAYFASIFKSECSNSSTSELLATVEAAIIPCLPSGEYERLSSLPDAKEIKYALFLIHPDKAPGPDGFSASFFHSNWDTIGPALVSEIQSFFRSGLMPAATNVTYVRLIPKFTSANLVANDMPIALCNVTYKVITKILSLRIKTILQDIISETQSAF